MTSPVLAASDGGASRWGLVIHLHRFSAVARRSSKRSPHTSGLPSFLPSFLAMLRAQCQPGIHASRPTTCVPAFDMGSMGPSNSMRAMATSTHRHTLGNAPWRRVMGAVPQHVHIPHTEPQAPLSSAPANHIVTGPRSATAASRAQPTTGQQHEVHLSPGHQASAVVDGIRGGGSTCCAGCIIQDTGWVMVPACLPRITGERVPLEQWCTALVTAAAAAAAAPSIRAVSRGRRERWTPQC
jgi:hypothetical protein